MSDLVNMIILAIVQGLTEFLPVSSSGHLVIARELLGVKTPGLTLVILLHVGTVVAVIGYYHRQILELLRGIFKMERRSLLFAAAVLISMIPAAVVGIGWGERIEAACENPSFTGGALLFTGAVLLLTRLIPAKREDPEGREVGVVRGFLIGLAQMVAVLPGVSRSGMTISAARFLGVRPEKAAEFSFIMVLPVILGGALLDAVKHIREPLPAETALSFLEMAVGFGVAAIVGYVSVAAMVKLLNRDRFWLFGFYCLAAGTLTLIFLR